MGDLATAPSHAAPYLNVDRSLCGKRWLQRAGDDRMALALAQRLGVPEIVGRVLSGRGIGLDDAPSFLEPTLRDLLPDPRHLKDMEAGAERLAAAVMGGEQVVVFGDYDVDGATSAALLLRFLRTVGGRARAYIPDRLREGYGPNAEALERLAGEGASLVVTVDCGITAHAPLEAAANAGLDVIVVDHHEAEPALPRAVAVINPNRLDETSPHRNLAAVGVSFLLVVAANRVLREAGWYTGRDEPSLLQWLDIVALGTVCDVVPLTGLNRALVTQGLKIMAVRRNAGLAALADVARLDEAPSAYHLGFVMGPRVNAGGRVGESHLGAELLSCDDPARAREIAARLDDYNKERREIEASVLADATAQADALPAVGAALVVAGEGWHPGVVGIVASRLVELYAVPACVVGTNGETGLGVGSGRSLPGIDLGAAVLAARQAGLLVKGGGHAMAAGFTVDLERLDELRAFLDERIGRNAAAAGIVPTLRLDGALSVRGATTGLIDQLERVGPFGAGNAEPRFALPNVRLVKADVVGGAHVRCIVTGPEGGRLKAIAFRSLDTPLGQALLNHGGAALHLAGRLRANLWQGTVSPQLLVDDAAPVCGIR